MGSIISRVVVGKGKALGIQPAPNQANATNISGAKSEGFAKSLREALVGKASLPVDGPLGGGLGSGCKTISFDF